MARSANLKPPKSALFSERNANDDRLPFSCCPVQGVLRMTGSRSFLFPDSVPPTFPSKATVPMACVWLMVVMDKSDHAHAFIASLLNHYYSRGFLTEKQMDALRGVCGKVIKKYRDQDLECWGADPADIQTLEFGNVLEMRRPALIEEEVLE